MSDNEDEVGLRIFQKESRKRNYRGDNEDEIECKYGAVTLQKILYRLFDVFSFSL